MSNRRKFIKKAVLSLTGLSVLPAVNLYAADSNQYERQTVSALKARFAVASDLHYGEQGTDFALHADNMVKWINEDHEKNHLDFIILNGDLVFNNAVLLVELKQKYLDKLKMQVHAVPGNHDFANTQIWESTFGYEDSYTFEFGDAGFVMANTADVTGNYFCPSTAFMTSALDKLKEKKSVFVVMHVPPVQWLEREKEYFMNCPDFVKLIHSYNNVKAVFHGHDHYLDAVRYTEKLPHFFDAHLGSSWGTSYRGYRIVEISNDNSIYTYQVNASQNPVLNNTKF